MKQGYLASFFKGVAYKKLSAVEADPTASRQHEFNGAKTLRNLLGDVSEKVQKPTRFIYLSDEPDDTLFCDGLLTWYDSRKNIPTRAAEYRLYYKSNPVTQMYSVEDIIILAIHSDDSILAICAKNASTISGQLLWLFDLQNESELFQQKVQFPSDSSRQGVVARLILDQIGIDPDPEPDCGDYCERMLDLYSRKFPTTDIFSKYARSTINKRCLDLPSDQLLLEWLNREEELFRWLERELISERLEQGFSNDVDAFIKFSLSVQNRRKSRVGYAFENHLRELFRLKGLRFAHTPVTENGNRPDFLFPGQKEYSDITFPENMLDMLGAKSTCKDRWRQVLSEAERIPCKHLITLEPAISLTQTTEMALRSLQLVVPETILSTYKPEQQAKIITLECFIQKIRKKQEGT